MTNNFWTRHLPPIGMRCRCESKNFFKKSTASETHSNIERLLMDAMERTRQEALLQISMKPLIIARRLIMMNLLPDQELRLNLIHLLAESQIPKELWISHARQLEEFVLKGSLKQLPE